VSLSRVWLYFWYPPWMPRWKKRELYREAQSWLLREHPNILVITDRLHYHTNVLFYRNPSKYTSLEKACCSVGRYKGTHCSKTDSNSTMAKTFEFSNEHISIKLSKFSALHRKENCWIMMRYCKEISSMFSVNNKPRNKHCSAINTWQHVTIQTQKDHMTNNWQGN